MIGEAKCDVRNGFPVVDSSDALGTSGKGLPNESKVLLARWPLGLL